jgi:hypothetical protein
LRALRERLLSASTPAQPGDPVQGFLDLLAAARGGLEETGQEEMLRRFDDYVDRKKATPSSEEKPADEN